MRTNGKLSQRERAEAFPGAGRGDGRVRPLSLVAPQDCSLTETGFAGQASRGALLAAAVARIEREPRRLEVAFTEALDRPLLDELIETERACCTFFRIGFEPDTRVLRVCVDDESRAPALDLVEAIFSLAPGLS